jgi:hypothetical protein
VASPIAAAQVRFDLDDPPGSHTLFCLANQMLAHQLASHGNRVTGVKASRKRQNVHEFRQSVFLEFGEGGPEPTPAAKFFPKCLAENKLHLNSFLAWKLETQENCRASAY